MHQVRLVHGNIFIDELDFVSTIVIENTSSLDELICHRSMFQTSALPLATVGLCLALVTSGMGRVRFPESVRPHLDTSYLSQWNQVPWNSLSKNQMITKCFG